MTGNDWQRPSQEQRLEDTAAEIREITRVAEAGEGWGVPASWH